MNDRISVHICTKDRHTELAILLHSLKNQTLQDFDIVILDDASGHEPLCAKFVQDIVQRLRLDGHGVKFIRNNISYGVCKARNQLLEEDPWKENTNFVCRLDDDVILEPDFLRQLWLAMFETENVGITSGVTPLLSGPDFKRETKFVKPIINELKFDEFGELTKIGDDCGYSYLTEDVIPTHHFRSNALIKRKLIDDGIRYPDGYSQVGFREELNFSIQAILAGYSIYVNTQAKALHGVCGSGGCRYPNYSQLVQSDELIMRKWMKMLYLKHGDFLKEYTKEYGGLE